MCHHRKNARKQFWSAKAIAKRHQLRAESRLPESKPLPTTRRLTAGLKPGEIDVIGWQHAPSNEPQWLTQMLRKNAAKAMKRNRYERAYRRRSV